MNRDLNKALDPEKLQMDGLTAAAVMEIAPAVLLMYDGGCFKHLIGRNARHLICNVRKLDRSSTTNE